MIPRYGCLPRICLLQLCESGLSLRVHVAQLRAICRQSSDDTSRGLAALDRLKLDGDHISDLERVLAVAGRVHHRGRLRLGNPIRRLAVGALHFNRQQTVRIGVEPLLDRPLKDHAFRGVKRGGTVMRKQRRGSCQSDYQCCHHNKPISHCFLHTHPFSYYSYESRWSLPLRSFLIGRLLSVTLATATRQSLRNWHPQIQPSPTFSLPQRRCRNACCNSPPPRASSSTPSDRSPGPAAAAATSWSRPVS